MTYATLADMGRHFLVHDTAEMRGDYYRWLVQELLHRGHPTNICTMTLGDLTVICERESGERIARAA